MATQDSRIKLKRSTVTGAVPTVPSSNDHTDGTWIATDIYKGELFYNQADGVLWTRGDSGIDCIQGTAKVVIPTAQVLTLNTTPVQLVAAPGAGYAIEVLSVTMKMVYNSAAYATNTILEVKNTGAIQPIRKLDCLNATVDTMRVITPVGATTATQTQMLENVALVATVGTSDPTAGDSDITIYITYRIITL